ncbi:putative RING finger protein 14-like [Capsicum chacoense]
MQEKTENWGEEFDKNYRQLVIHDMIGEVSEIVDDECNKDRTIHLDVRVRVKLVVHHSSSILGLVKNMEVDEDVANEDCMICLEKLGEERELMCMPCSHLFHGDCITTWLENGNSCPVCRYDLLAN